MDIKAKTRHGELTLDEIGSLMPGMSELMVAMGHRFQTMYHACRDNNWLLGGYQFRVIRKLFNTSKITRPKYAQAVDEYSERYMAPIEAAIQAKDWERFSTAVEAAVAASDEYHKTWGYGYIQYRVSPDPSGQYRLVSPADG